MKLLGTNGTFQRKLLSLKGPHYCKRESLTSIFDRVTTQVSQIQRQRHLPGCIEMLWQLPKIVHSLQKQLIFYPPEDTVREKV